MHSPQNKFTDIAQCIYAEQTTEIINKSYMDLGSYLKAEQSRFSLWTVSVELSLHYNRRLKVPSVFNP